MIMSHRSKIISFLDNEIDIFIDAVIRYYNLKKSDKRTMLDIWKRTFPDYTIIYIFCLSDWFKKNCISELEYLNFKNIPYFWGNSETYKDDIINFIFNYK